MKRKLILVIIICFFFFPFMVNAETCDINKISISSITIKDKSENVNEIEEATATGKNINLNLSMSEVGDNIEYKVVIKNESNEDYELDKNSFNINSDYINYTFEFEDNSNVIKANSSKVIFLKAEYEHEVPDEVFESGSFTDNKNISLQLTSANKISTLNPFKNPNTGNTYLLLVIVILIMSAISFIILRKRKYAKYMSFIIGITIIIPISVYALCRSDIKIDTKIRIDKTNVREPLYLYGIIDGVDIGDSVDVVKVDDLPFIEQFGDNFYSIGGSLLSTSADIVFNMYSQDTVFLKFEIEDNVITGIGIECYYNNNRYSLNYGPSYFEANKQVLNSAFGEDRCSFNYNYYCQDSIGGNFSGSATIDGDISFAVHNYRCSMNQYKTRCGLD